MTVVIACFRPSSCIAFSYSAFLLQVCYWSSVQFSSVHTHVT